MATVTLSAPAQKGKGVSSLPVVAGYRFPAAADIKEEWSQKYWDGECRKAKEGDKKAEGDATEDFGRKEEAEDVESRVARVEFACRKLKYPAHSAVGDYNGDGVQDEARILISTKDPTYGRVVFFLKSKTGGIKIVRTDLEFYPLRGHYIETLKPSGEKILTICGLAESECDSPSDLKSITLKRDGLKIGAFEGRDTIVYWDSRLNKFKYIEN